jgi:DEAD/DEAH box helicase domain-containing protein
MREDALKRSAIVASGAYWVWSVTHQDVAAALAVNLDTDLESPLVALSRHQGAKAGDSVPRAQEKAFTQHGVARLLQWLSVGAGTGDTDPAVEAMQRNAVWLEFLMIPATLEDKAVCDGQRAQWLPRLPLYIREPGTGYAPVMSRANGPAAIVGWWAMALAKGIPAAGQWSSPGAVVLDELGAPDEDALHQGWRRWLQLYNTAQFTPGILMATSSGLDAHDYEVLGSMLGEAQSSGKPQGSAGLSAAWGAVLEQTLSKLAEGLKSLAATGAVPPEVGTELADEKGKVLADAELTWVDQKVALLRPDQADLAESWQAAGWTAWVLGDELDTIQGQPWTLLVAGALDVTLKNEGE